MKIYMYFLFWPWHGYTQYHLKGFYIYWSSKMLNSQGCIVLFALYVIGIHTIPKPLDTFEVNLNIEDSDPTDPLGGEENLEGKLRKSFKRLN